MTELKNWFSLGGEMGIMIHAKDWSQTSLGPVEHWPQGLRSIVRMLSACALPMITLWGPDLIQIYNDGYRELMGAKHPAGFGQPTRSCWPEVWHINAPIYARVLAGETLSFQDALYPINRHGHLEDAWFTLSYSPLYDDDDAIAGVMVTVSETTGRLKAEAGLRDSEQLLSQMFQQAPTFKAMLREPNHTFRLVNPGYMQLVGYRDVIGKTVVEVLPEAVEQGFVALLDGVYRSGKAYTARGKKFAMQSAQGGPVRERFVDFVYQPLKDAKGNVFGIFVEGADVTERAQAEQALQNLTETLEQQVDERTRERDQLWESSEDLLVTADYEGHLLKISPSWTTLLGWSETQILEEHYAKIIHPDDFPVVMGALQGMQKSGIPVKFEDRLLDVTGKWHWISWQLSPQPGGKHLTGIGRNVTEEKARQAELEAAQGALRQSQKMEAVGQLTGGLAHDFNNLLAVVLGSLEILERRMLQGRINEIGQFLTAAQGAGKRAAALTHRLLAFSRRQTLDPKPTNLNQLVAGMNDLVCRTVGPGIAIEVVGAAGLWTTFVDPSQLESALLNLCINARDAMPDGGRLTIETANKWLDERTAREQDIQPGQYVSLCVRDTGCGMSSEVIARAFEPFFTTKPIGQGTGLGLSMIYGFARQSGGQARIDSEVGQGTTVCVYIPRHYGNKVADAKNPIAIPSRAEQGETILVVDDEPGVCMLVAEMLEELNYNTLEAKDGPAALKIIQSNARIDLLVTDVGLPGGMSGWQVADAARIVRPDLKVLFITGYAENAMVGDDHLEPGTTIMTKPFALNMLANRIKELILKAPKS